MRFLPLAAILLAASAAAQVRPSPGPGDARLQSVVYDPEQVVELDVALGYQITVALAADERIENIAVGDGAAWQVTANGRGDHVFIKALQPGARTNVTVVTDVRTYSFALAATDGAASQLPFVVRFTYPAGPAQAQATAAAPAPDQGSYDLTGTRALWPEAMSDDGARTYIKWPEAAPLPAVFLIDERGAEVVADGHMRDGLYSIDAVRERLVFRLDGKIARATRVVERRR